MTTESMQDRRRSGASLLLGAAAATAALGLVASALGLAVGGSAAALGCLIGVAFVVVLFASGSLLVNAVAGLMPTLSLLVALMTFGLQMVVALVVFVALDSSAAVGTALDRAWLGGGAIGAVLAWTAVQVVATTRTRVPVYDLPGPATGVGR